MTTVEAIYVCPSAIIQHLFEVLATHNPARAAEFACAGFGLGLGLCTNAIDTLPAEDVAEVLDTFNGLCNVLGQEGISLEIVGKHSSQRTVTPIEAARGA